MSKNCVSCGAPLANGTVCALCGPGNKNVATPPSSPSQTSSGRKPFLATTKGKFIAVGLSSWFLLALIVSMHRSAESGHVEPDRQLLKIPSEKDASGRPARPRGDLVPGETVEHGQCKFKLVRAGVLNRLNGGPQRRAGVVFEISTTDRELKHSCSFDLKLLTTETRRKFESDITTAPSVEPGASVCFSNQILTDFNSEFSLVVSLRDGGAVDESFAKSMVRGWSSDFVLGGVVDVADEAHWIDRHTGFSWGSSCESLKPEPSPSPRSATTLESPEALDLGPGAKAWAALVATALTGSKDLKQQLDTWCQQTIHPKFQELADHEVCSFVAPWWIDPKEYKAPGNNALEVRDNEGKRQAVAAAWADGPVVKFVVDSGANARRSRGFDAKTSTFSFLLFGDGYSLASQLSLAPGAPSEISVGRYAPDDRSNQVSVQLPVSESIARQLYKTCGVQEYCEHEKKGCDTDPVEWEIVAKVESVAFLGQDCSGAKYGAGCDRQYGPKLRILGLRLKLKGGNASKPLDKDSEKVEPGTVLYQWIAPKSAGK